MLAPKAAAFQLAGQPRERSRRHRAARRHSAATSCSRITTGWWGENRLWAGNQHGAPEARVGCE